MSEKTSAARILADFLSPVDLPLVVLDEGVGMSQEFYIDWQAPATSSNLPKGRYQRGANQVTETGHPAPRAMPRRADGANPAVAVEKDDPSAKVLGFLAANGPTRSVDVIDHLVDEDNPKSPLTLTAIASAIDHLAAQGTLERRQGERIAVIGDPR